MDLKVSIIGARRVKEGTGPFIAKFFIEEGCKITSVLGTHRKSLNQVQKEFYEKYRIQINTYRNIEKLMKLENPNIVVITSPKETHFFYIKKLLKYKCNIFCEKPLIWNCENSFNKKLLTKLKFIEDILHKKNSLLQLTNQWPYSINSFCRIYNIKSIKNIKIKRFKMTLTSAEEKKDTLAETLPHPISMVELVFGYGEFEDIKFKKINTKSRKSLRIESNFISKKGNLKTTFVINFSSQTPRPASYSINQMAVHRFVDIKNNYQMYFKSNKQKYIIKDPMRQSVSNFINKIKRNKLKSNIKSINFQMRSLLIFISKYKKSKSCL